jgi:EAL domain-containing protein (putative c-di-GMP-specific phosphodiesterase class I)
MPSLHLSAATADLRSVRQLVERRALAMHFQPLVRLDTAEVRAHEALVRPPARCPWPTPDALFEAARAEGSLERLEVECVRLALATWTAAGARGQLFVNLGADVLVAAIAGGRLDAALDLVRAAGASPQALVIELTEHERVREVDALRAALDRVRAHGIALALDDFGDGRSSLRLWSELKPEYVKVDKYFSRGIDRNGSKVQTLRALLQIAETLGAQLVAEGVETADELRTLRDLGVA